MAAKASARPANSEKRRAMNLSMAHPSADRISSAVLISFTGWDGMIACTAWRTACDVARGCPCVRMTRLNESPSTLTAHVLVKLALTVVGMALMVAAGKRYYPIRIDVPIFGFAMALLISTWSILSIGFLIASIVPTARFAQPIGAAILYPMLALCGLFVPTQSLSPALQVVAHVLPLTYAVALLEGIWKGEAWSAHIGDIAALVVVFAVCTALSAKVFRWE
jgi:ABC-type polysaccharide/polyol phosphate export permease